MEGESFEIAERREGLGGIPGGSVKPPHPYHPQGQLAEAGGSHSGALPLPSKNQEMREVAPWGPKEG